MPDLSDRIRAVLDSPSDSFTQLTQIAGLNPCKAYRFANLQGVDLSDQDLSGYDFTGANLTGANLNGAIVTGTIFDRAILAEDALMNTITERDPIVDAQLESAGYVQGQQDYENETKTDNPYQNTPEGDIWARGYRQGKRHAKQGII